MRLATIYFGIIRNVDATLGSLERIGRTIDAEGIERVTIASLNRIPCIDNPRSGENGVAIAADDWERIPADHRVLADQDDRAIERELAAAMAQPDLFDDGYRSVRNVLHQLASLRRGWLALERLEPKGFDAYLLLRPDLRYLDCPSVRDLSARLPDGRSILIPPWHNNRGLNDRFAFAGPAAARIYAMRFDRLTDYCRRHPLDSEQFLAWVLADAGVKLGALPVRAERVRADGVVRTVHGDHAEDFEFNRLPLPRIAAPFVDAPVRFAPGQTATIARRAEPAEDKAGAVRPAASPGRVPPLAGLHYLDFLRALHGRLGPVRYLEIGTQAGLSLRPAAGPAVAIDPEFQIDLSRLGAKLMMRLRPRRTFYAMESDRYFATHDPRFRLRGAIDLAFIDGMHLAEYALRDFINVEAHCADTAMVMLHDAVPLNFEMTERVRDPDRRTDRETAGAWTGDVWRVIPALRRLRPDLKIEVLDCPPTGLVMIRGVDPTSRVLGLSAETLARAFAETAPDEAEFWAYIRDLRPIDSRAWLVENAAWLKAVGRSRATGLLDLARTKLANGLSKQFRRLRSRLASR